MTHSVQLPFSPLNEKFVEWELEDSNNKQFFADQYPLRILIADDEYTSRRILTMLLQRWGYKVDSVEDGLECLDAALGGTYDLILSDVDMPNMGGFECTNNLREAGIKIPIIAVSATSVENPYEHCLRAGMNGYLPKPVPQEELKSILREAFYRKVRKAEIRPK
jgi:CheY-like chemotaxis protein